MKVPHPVAGLTAYQNSPFYDHVMLLSEQYGFCANRSAELAAIKLVDYIVHEIDRKLHLSTYILIFQKHLIH